jgi:hypothetical protein
MKNDTSPKSEFSQAERQLIEKLRQRPEMMERVRSILAIAEEAGGAMTADQVEALLVEEMRKPGNTTMRDWAGGVQERLGTDLRQKEATLRSRKKKR